MDISIIIPVFNAAKYLDRCLNSVLASVAHSSFRYEIILVDNNSTDDSLKLCQKYQKSRPAKIKILHQPTPGASAARNLGAAHARGEFIWFIDSDDAITLSAVSTLINKARNQNADLTMLTAKRIYPQKYDYLTAVSPAEDNYKSRFVRYGAGPWQFLIRRKWWQQNNFTFREGIIHEDMELISSLILYTDKFAAVSAPIYHYYQNPDSVLHKSSYDPHSMDIFPALSGLYARFEKAHALEKYHSELEWFFIWNLLIDSAKDFAKSKAGKAGRAKTREFLKKYYPRWRKNPFFRQKSLRFRIRCLRNYRRH